MARRGSAIERVILWLFVIALGIGVGAGLYELRVITPLWAGAPPESVWGWRDLLAANPAYAPHGGDRFWIIVTPARALLALAVLITAFRVRDAQRTWRLVAGTLGLFLFAIAALWLIPISTDLFATGDAPGAEAVVSLTNTYVTLNYVFQLVGFAAFLAALRALSLPPASESGRQFTIAS